MANVTGYTKATLDQMLPVGLWSPPDAGLLLASFDPGLMAAGAAVTPGRAYGVKVYAPEVMTIAQFWTVIDTGGTLTSLYYGVYTAAGTQIATTANLGGTISAGIAASAALTVTAGQSLTLSVGYYYLVGLTAGGTGARWSASGAASYNSAYINVGPATSKRAVMTSATGLTTLPSPLGTVVAADRAVIWFGIS